MLHLRLPRHARRLARIATTTGLLAFACGGPPPSDPAAKLPPEATGPANPGEPVTPAPALPDDGRIALDPAQAQLRTGTAAPIAEPAMVGEAQDLATTEANPHDGGTYLRVALPALGALAGAYEPRVHVDQALALFDGTQVVVRWPRGVTVPERVEGTLYYAGEAGSWSESPRWHARPFSAPRPKASAASSTRDPAPAVFAWASALESHFGRSRAWEATHPWYAFARERIAAAVRAQASDRHGPDTGGFGPGTRQTDLARLMDTTTANLSIQEALQHDRGLRLGWERGASEIAIGDLRRIPLAAHPFAEMQRKLPAPDGATPEPLAAHAPADFWYLRFTDLRVFLRTLDEADAWGTPVQQVLQEDPSDHGLASRYQDQLGLARSELARQFGHAVVDRLAIVGSDPYLREGSDMTVIFAVANATLFDQQLASHLAELSRRVPGIQETTELHEGVEIRIARDPSGRVRQHRARLGDLQLVSNSPTAIRRVIDASAGRAPRLADEPDFRYMLARDPGEHDALAFLGDRFIAAVISPEQKIAEARRQQALAELSTPGYAALAFGWLHGREPVSTQELVDAGLLDFAELTHADGSPIDFQPGASARSKWGSPAMLTPRIDLPALTHVSEAERGAYERFADGYQQNWTQFIDPVAVRLDLETEGDREHARVEVRVLPLIDNSDYDEILNVVGDERAHAPALTSGVRAVWAVGDTRLREELNGSAKLFSGKEGIGIDWLGSWVMVGALDRPPLLEAARFDGLGIELPAPEDPKADRAAEQLAEARRFARLPAYAAAAVGNAPALVATLAALRGVANEVAPGMVDWKEHSRHGEVAIVRIGISPNAPDAEARAMADAIALYYAQLDGALVIALDPEVLKVFIDQIGSASTMPSAGKEADPQFVIESRAEPNDALGTAALWLMQGQANRTQTSARAAAEALLRGAPTSGRDRFAQLAADYFGAVPVSASGRSDYSLAADGVHDGLHGSQITPTFPALPVDDSPISRLTQRLEGVRAEVSFDHEAGTDAGARSLHTRFELALRPQ